MPAPRSVGAAIGSSVARRASSQPCVKAANTVRALNAIASTATISFRLCSKSQTRSSSFCVHGVPLCCSPIGFQSSVTHLLCAPLPSLQSTGSYRFHIAQRYYSNNRSPPEDVYNKPYSISKKDAGKLVNIYNERNKSKTSSFETPSIQGYLSEGKTLPKVETSVSPEVSEELSQLLQDLRMRVSDTNSGEDFIWELYQRIPEPRCLYAPDVTRHLISRLSTVKFKTSRGFIRYTSLISDLKAVNYRVSLLTWNTAISYAGRCLKKIRAADVEAALNIWREMEQDAQVQSNNVTFNILFDVAAKARRFALAEMIVREMETRNLEFSRHFRTSLIYYYGLRKDGANVRKAYSELINAGEIVDTSVINCVIFALIHCKELGAAEQVFERAKELHASKVRPGLPPKHWHKRRVLGRKLGDATEKQRETNREKGLAGSVDSPETAELRHNTSIAPDAVTFKILIREHAVKIGDINRAAELIDEMSKYDLDVHGSIFLWIFIAFDVHGGVPYSQWTWRRLENTWTAFVDTLDAHNSAKHTLEAILPVSGPKSHVDRPFFDPNENIRQWSGDHSQDGSQQRHSPVIQGQHEEEADATISTPEANNDDIVESSNPAEPEPLLGQGLYRSIDELSDDPRIYISRLMAVQIGKAFAKCSHIARTAQIWVEVKRRWTPEVVNDVVEVETELAAAFPGREHIFYELVASEESKSHR